MNKRKEKNEAKVSVPSKGCLDSKKELQQLTFHFQSVRSPHVPKFTDRVNSSCWCWEYQDIPVQQLSVALIPKHGRPCHTPPRAGVNSKGVHWGLLNGPQTPPLCPIICADRVPRVHISTKFAKGACTHAEHTPVLTRKIKKEETRLVRDRVQS